MDLLASGRAPWRKSVSVDYHPRAIPLPQRLPDGPGVESDAGRLIRDLDYLFSCLCPDSFEPLTILALSLSWRHPDVVAPLLAGSVWWHFRLTARL